MITEEARLVLETLARSFTDRNDLKVVWDSFPCTDFKKIYIQKSETIVPGVKCTPGELWLSQKAIIAHESAHLLFTDESAWKSFCQWPLEANILNIIEDARVERAMTNLFPGVLRWFRFANEYIFVNRKNWIDLQPQDQALHELCSYAVVGRIHDELPERERKFVQECASYVDRGRTAKTTEEAAKEAAKIVEIYKRYYRELPSIPEPEINFSTKPMSAPEGELDPRRKPKLKPLHGKPEGGKPEEPADDKPDGKPDGEPSDKPYDGEEPIDSSDCEPSDGDTVDSEPSDGETADSSDSEPSDGDTVDELDGEPDGEPSGESAGDSSGESGESDSGSPDQSGDPDESPSGVPGGKETDRKSESDDSQDELLSDICDLLEKSEEEAAQLSVPEIEEVPEEEKISEDDIKEKFTLSRCHSRRKLKFENVDSYPATKSELEREIYTTALLTANEIRKILESRKGGTRRCLPKGRLDRSSLWKVAVKEPNIFMRKNAPSNNPDLAVYLLIDCSGSMEIPVSKRCCTRLHCAAEAGILLHRVCKNLNIPHAATGFTTEDFSDGHAKHYKLKEFHEREARIEAILKEVYCSDNVDGFSIRAAAAELLCRPELNKILFVISDGLPEAVEYRGGEAVEDTVKAVREVISYGIGVIGIFIGDERQSMLAKEIYPHLIFLDAGDLPIILAKTLKIVITNPA
jgi:hypothetical protein